MTTTTEAARPAGGKAGVTIPDALASTWRAIRRRHRDVPAVALSVTPGRGSACGTVVWDADMPVILLSAQTVSAGPRAILQALLHQAAHGILRARGDRPATSTGRYHSSDYRDMAASVGLQPGPGARGTGWSETVLRDDTAGVYAAQLAELAAAIEHWEPPAPPPGSASWSAARNGITAACRCTPPRTIRLRGRSAADDLRDRPIRCEACGQLFAETS
jgi:hypothetical protein